MSILETLTAERAKYGERLTPALAYELLNRVAVQHPGCGLLKKTAGNQYHGCALDILFTKADGHHYDVLIDAPDATSNPPYNGTSRPAWQDKGPMDLGRWVAPVGAAPAPEQPPPDPPQTVPVCDSAQKIAALTELVNEWIELTGKLGEDLHAYNERLKAVEEDLATGFEVSTSRAWGHSHKVKVGL